MHYNGDVLDILYRDWDMVIAHPPCTYLANSGVCWLYPVEENQGRWNEVKKAIKFFMKNTGYNGNEPGKEQMEGQIQNI